MSNRTDGTRFEREVAQQLKASGYWVLQIPQSTSGQPADLLAIRGDEIKLIDCKLAYSGRFEFKRIEPNQREAMKMFQKRTNGKASFMIRFLEEVQELNFDQVIEFENLNKHSISSANSKKGGASNGH